MNYPTYYRKDNRCLKRESDTTAIEVRIPGKDQFLPVVHHDVTYPTKQRLDDEINCMDQVDSDTYEAYLADLFKALDKNRRTYNEFRQARFEKLSSIK